MKSYLTTAFIILFGLSGFSQASGNYMYNLSNRWQADAAQVFNPAVPVISGPNLNATQTTFQINTLANAVADSYMAIFHITQVGPDARKADSLINKRINGFRDHSILAGMNREDFMVDMLSMVPIYEIEVTGRLFSKTYNEVPAGFEIQKNIHIRFTDPELLDKLITGAAFNEIYDMVKVEYFVKDHYAILDSLRTEAKNLLDKRFAHFQNLGIELQGNWRMVTESDQVFYPQDRYTRYQSFTNTSVDASRKKGDVQQMKKPSTMFYDKLRYNDFDLIMNPEILEPVVQYTYTLTIAVEIKRPEEPKEPVAPKPEVVVETVHKYFLLTDEGEIKSFELKE